jgi:ribosomal protein L11 methyltransferase
VKWAEIEVCCAPESVDAVSELLVAAGCGGTAVREEGRSGVQSDTLRAGRSSEAPPSPLHPLTPSPLHPCRVLGYLPVDDRLEASLAMLRERLQALPRYGLPVEEGLTLRTVQDQDWESAWKQYFKPLRVGRRMVVKPSWEEYAARPEDLVLELDPGMAFGTGAHPTTQLCLETLEEVVRPGDRVLDFGTGSGILAIAAARLGAQLVIGLDIDPVAAGAAELNVTGNCLRDRVRILGGDLDSLPPGQTFDGIVANILAGVILDAAPGLASRCRVGGWLVTSGIIEHRAQAVADELYACGFLDIETRRRGEWVALTARRGPDP